MTRVNAAIPVEKLCDKHLMGEFYEITRIPSAIKSGKAKIYDIPPTFRLGSGHVKFFYDKLQYLHKRYNAILAELERRRFNISTLYDWSGLPEHLYNDWQETPEAYNILAERLNSRLYTVKNLRYSKKPVSPADILIPLL